MVWKRLPKDVQKTILAMIFFLGGANVACWTGPLVCDPAPPPSSPTPKAVPPFPSATPMVCDPAPPPSATPTVCDPPPPPPVTPAPGQRFAGQVISITSNPDRAGAAIMGVIYTAYGEPVVGARFVAWSVEERAQAISDQQGFFLIEFWQVGKYELFLEGDDGNAVELDLKEHDEAFVEWREIREESSHTLPLAEVRTAEIVWLNGLTFAVESPWPGARYRWSVSGGALTGEGETVTWQPPAKPGRYLLQVVADWERSGLAVDAVVLTVEEDGSVTSG